MLRYHWFPREMISEERAQKFHTDNSHYPDLGSVFDWLCGKFASANQKLYPDLGSVTSSVWNFCTPFSDVITRNVGFFLRLVIPWLNAFTFYLSTLMSYRYSQFQPSVSKLNEPVLIRGKYHTRQVRINQAIF